MLPTIACVGISRIPRYCLCPPNGLTLTLWKALGLYQTIKGNLSVVEARKLSRSVNAGNVIKFALMTSGTVHIAMPIEYRFSSVSRDGEVRYDG